MVPLHELVPRSVAQLDRPLGRADDVGEEHRRERPIERGLLLAHRGDEPLELGQDGLGVAEERGMLVPRQDRQLGTRDLLRDPPALIDRLGTIAFTVQHERRRLDRRQDGTDVDLVLGSIDRDDRVRARTEARVPRPRPNELPIVDQ